jgi:hypothetical protein
MVDALHLLTGTPIVVVLCGRFLVYSGKGNGKCQNGKHDGVPRRLPECGNKKHVFTECSK